MNNFGMTVKPCDPTVNSQIESMAFYLPELQPPPPKKQAFILNSP